MKDRIVCPFFGKNDDDCDVGCGYISPHDVDMIIRFCSANYQECRKYRQLFERLSTSASLQQTSHSHKKGEPL